MELLPELLAYAEKGGAPIAAAFIILWWLERAERKEAQEQNSAMVEKVIMAMQETKTALQTFGSILASPRNGNK